MAPLASSFSSVSIASTHQPPEWVVREKVRLGWSPRTLEQYPLMKASGMNAVMPRIELVAERDYQPEAFERIINREDEIALTKLRESSHRAKELGLRYFHCLGIACTGSTVRAGFSDNGARFNDQRLPSPIDPVYWKRAILDRVDRALRLLADEEVYALDAIIIDPEMYALGDGIPGEPDFGGYAFNRFLSEHPDLPQAALSDPAERREWLTKENLLKDYIAWQHREIAKLGQSLRALVERHRPGLIVGFIIYENRLWFNAIAEGLSAGGMPVFVGPESTYSGVMDANTVELFERMRKSVKVPAIFVPGVSVGMVRGRHAVERLKQLPGNIYQRCQHSDGYWVYAIYNFGSTAEEQEPYFDALRTVNDALDEQALTGKVVPGLEAGPFPAELPPYFQEALAYGTTLKPMDAATPRPDVAPAPAVLRGSYTFLLWPKRESRNSVVVQSVQLNPNYLDPVSTTLFDRAGREVYVAPTALGKKRIVWLPDLVNDFCVQISSAGQNAFSVPDSTAPIMIYAPQGITTNSQGGHAGTFYFYVPEGCKQFTLELSGRERETMEYLLHSPDGKADQSWSGVHRDTQAVISTGGEPGVWAISIRNARNNAGFRLVSLPNLFALRAEDLHH